MVRFFGPHFDRLVGGVVLLLDNFLFCPAIFWRLIETRSLYIQVVFRCIYYLWGFLVRWRCLVEKAFRYRDWGDLHGFTSFELDSWRRVC